MRKRLERYENWHAQQVRDPLYRKEFERIRKRGLLAVRIARVREVMGLSQRQFAERMGVKQSALARIESGEEDTLKLRTLEKIARAAHRELVITFSKIPGWCPKCGGEIERSSDRWVETTRGFKLSIVGLHVGQCRSCGDVVAREDLAKLTRGIVQVVEESSRGRAGKVRLSNTGVVDARKLEEVVL